MSARPRPPQPPVELPQGVDHGKARAYNFYRCRCELCGEWRRSYDREYWEIRNRTGRRRERSEKS